VELTTVADTLGAVARRSRGFCNGLSKSNITPPISKHVTLVSSFVTFFPVCLGYLFRLSRTPIPKRRSLSAMAEIEHAARSRSLFDEEKKTMDFPQRTADEESPNRIEEGEKGGLFLSEEEVVSHVKAYPDDATPIYLTWGVNDPTNPRNWPVRLNQNLHVVQLI
jgi:hypothetical protein